MSRRKKTAAESSGPILTTIVEEKGLMRARAYRHGVPDRDGEPHQMVACGVYVPGAEGIEGLRALLIAISTGFDANGGAS